MQRSARKPLLQLAREHDLFAVAIVLDLPEAVSQERNRARPDRDFGPHVVRQQRSQMKGAAKKLRREGFHRVWVAELGRGGRGGRAAADAAVDRPARRARARST